MLLDQMANTHPLPPALAPLANHNQFIVCQLLPDPSRPGKTLKWPLHPHTLYRHDAHDPGAWLSHGEAAAIVDTCGPGYAVGFTFTAALGLWFIDLDECLTPTGWSDTAQQLCARLAGAAIEVSQSGRGLHIVGTLPPGGRPDHGCRNSAMGLEAYTGERFMVIGSGAVGSVAAAPVAILDVLREYFPSAGGSDGAPDDWSEAPVTEWSGPADDAKLLEQAMRSGSTAGAFGGRASFADLWAADPVALGRTWPDEAGGRAFDASQADGALAGHLAFWTGKNCARIETLMRGSALARDKWNRADGKYGTYLRRTIVGAVARCSAVYGEGRPPALNVKGTSVNASNHATNNVANGAIDHQATGLSFTAAAGGLIAATVANVESALLADESGIKIAHDTFKDRLSIAEGDSWRPFKDADYGHLRAALERRGFKPIGAEVMATSVGMVADRNSFNSAQVWANSLVWDGVPRVTMALHRYYGVEDTPYSRASAEYMFSGLAGRCLDPGCQADMALILVGVQGARKTSCVSALAPDAEAFAGVDLARRDDDLARRLRGKLVIELAEMRGLSQGRELEAIKDWITRRIEEWTPKYKEFGTRFPRHCLFIGTANDTELLDDPTGERRWLPQIAGMADVEALMRDRDQLWAEGVAMWRAGGIRWQQAEHLAKDEHHKYKVHDEWRHAVVRWLQDLPSVAWGHATSDVANGERPFSMLRVAREALNVTSDRFSMGEQKRVGKLLKGLGYEKKVVRYGETLAKLWVRVAGNTTGNKND